MGIYGITYSLYHPRGGLEAWDITVSDLFATVWDTAAVSTGVDHGACAYIEH